MNVFSLSIQRAVHGLSSIALFLMVCSAQAGELSSDVPADWVRLDANSAFSLSAPAGTTYTPAQGIDSMVGSFDAAAFQLNFDYGAYSNSLSNLSEEEDYQIRDVEIDGKPAKIVTAVAPSFSEQQPYFIGVHFPDLGQSVVGTKRLTVYAMLESPDTYPLIEQIYGTIQFN